MANRQWVSRTVPALIIALTIPSTGSAEYVLRWISNTGTFGVSCNPIGPVGDFDGDGFVEVVFRGATSLSIRDALTGVVEGEISGQFPSCAAPRDLDGDGVPELLLFTNGGGAGFGVIDYVGTPSGGPSRLSYTRPGYSVAWQTSDRLLSDIDGDPIGDYDGDGYLEVGLGGPLEIRDVLSGELEFLPQLAFTNAKPISMDLDGDNQPELIFYVHGGPTGFAVIDSGSIASISEIGSSPQGGGSLQISRNPSAHTTEIGFHIGRAGFTRLTIQDALGRRIRTLMSGAASAGRHSVQWDGHSDSGAAMAAGMYFYQLAVDGTQLGSAKAVYLP